jgi:hypothetical protein
MNPSVQARTGMPTTPSHLCLETEFAGDCSRTPSRKWVDRVPEHPASTTTSTPPNSPFPSTALRKTGGFNVCPVRWQSYSIMASTCPMHHLNRLLTNLRLGVHIERSSALIGANTHLRDRAQITRIESRGRISTKDGISRMATVERHHEA